MVSLWGSFHFSIRDYLGSIPRWRNKLLHYARHDHGYSYVLKRLAHHMAQSEDSDSINEQALGGGAALPDAASALGKAGLASRTNTLFSLPMLFFMGASGHLNGIGRIPMSSDEGVSALALALTLLIVAALEINAVKGKTGPMTSVKGVIHCGIGLLAALVIIIEVL